MRGNSPSPAMSMPAAACSRTASLSPVSTSARNAPRSTSSPASILPSMSSSAGDRGRLPTWVTSMRSLL